MQDRDDISGSDAVESAIAENRFDGVALAGVQCSSACSTAMVALPSRRSLATGLPSTSSEAVRSSTSSTIWNAMPRLRPYSARRC